MLLSRQTQAVARLPRQASTPAGPSRPRCSAVAPLAAAVAAPPASLDVKSFKDGSSAGAPATLSLAVAEEDTAGAVVHRYVVMLRQNARAVSFVWLSEKMCWRSPPSLTAPFALLSEGGGSRMVGPHLSGRLDALPRACLVGDA